MSYGNAFLTDVPWQDLCGMHLRHRSGVVHLVQYCSGVMGIPKTLVLDQRGNVASPNIAFQAQFACGRTTKMHAQSNNRFTSEIVTCLVCVTLLDKRPT